MRLLVVVGALALPVVLAACGGGDGEQPEPPSVDAEASTTTSSAGAAPTPGVAAPDAAGCTGDEASPPAAAADLTLELASGTEVATGAVTWRLLLTNEGGEPVTLVYGSGRDGDVVLSRAGQERYRWSAETVFAAQLRCQTLPPGSSYELVLSGTPLVVEPGQYELAATVAANPAPPPLATTVTVTG